MILRCEDPSFRWAASIKSIYSTKPLDVCSQNGHLTSTLATVFHIQNRTFHTAINILNTRPKKASASGVGFLLSLIYV